MEKKKKEKKYFEGEDGKNYVTEYNGGDPKNPTSYVTKIVFDKK